MDLWKVFIVLLLGLFCSTGAQNFYVAAPNLLRLNAAETIAVVDEGSRHSSVKVYVQDYPGKTKIISQTTVPVSSGQPEIFKINLDPANLPLHFFNSPSKMVYLTAEIRSIKKEIIVPVSMESGFVFIQTDKPIYNPNQNASIRIISLNEDKIISHKDLKLQILNPNGVIVKERLYQHTAHQPAEILKTEVYKFPSYPVLGNWSATVFYGYEFQLKSTVSFELREYVLPTFTVELKIQDVILPSAETIRIEVNAQYVYKKKVQGIVSFQVGVKKKNRDTIFFGVYGPKELDQGSYELNINIDDLKKHKDLEWFPAIQGSRLVVETTVVDAASGNKENVTDSKTRFSTSAFDISFKGCLMDFKPGLNSVFEAHVNYVNGNPAAGISTRIKAMADNAPLNIAEDSAVSDDNGKVSFEIQPEVHHSIISVTVETTDSRYVGSQATGTFEQKKTELSNNAYISISRSTSQRLKPGDMFSKLIHFQPGEITNVYYMVINKGKIITMELLPPGEFKVQALKFQVTHEMVPSFRLVVFTHYRRQFLADSLKIDVERVCDPRTEVFIENDFEVKEPGYEGKINLRGTAGTWVGLLGVDEAVYALSKKDLLTKAKMFDRFASHDLGCGPGGGMNVNSVLSNAGIIITTNHFSPVTGDVCGKNGSKRRKRSTEDIVNRYSTELEKECCRLGIQSREKENTQIFRTCEERAGIEIKLTGKTEDCFNAFSECCLNVRTVFLSKKIYPDAFDSNVYSIRILNVPAPPDESELPGEYTDPDDEDFFEESTSVRSDFLDTWIFQNFELRSDNKQEFRAKLPHSITTWVVQAVSVSPQHGMCVAEPQKLVSFKKIFLHLNLPYSVVRNEQVEIQATVFNYGNKKLAVTVYMYGVENLCTGTQPGQRSERKRFYIDEHSAQSVTFPVIPLKAGVFPIKVVVLSNEGNDIIQKELLVVPEGITKEIDIPIKLDPTNEQKRNKRNIYLEHYSDTVDPYRKTQETTVTLKVPNNHVPGTASCCITAIGDQMGLVVDTSMNNPDALLKGPGKCGEQNMVNLAPTLYTIKHLTVSRKLTSEQEKKGYEYIRRGYDTQMQYRKKDGSYAAFIWRESSTWLTAFVMKVFCQAKELINIDENVLKSGLLWLVDKQEWNGSYVESKPVYEKNMMGGVQGRIPLTAFVLIALKECKYPELVRLQRSEERAVAFLEANFDFVNKPLPTAIVAYALALSDSNAKHVAYTRLLSMATIDTDRNMMHWETENGAQDIETAGYALLTQLLLNDLTRSVSTANWLNTKQQQSGFFKSTQDTIVALQSLSEYAIRTPVPRLNLTSTIFLRNDRKIQMLNFNESNALLLQDVEVENVGGNLSIYTQGDGVAYMSVKLRYNLVEPVENICKFDISINIMEEPCKLSTQMDSSDSVRKDFSDLSDSVPAAKLEGQERNGKTKFLILLCVRYLGIKETEMSIVDVGLFSGFYPDIESLKEIQDDPNHLIQMYEITNRGVVFYLEKVPTEKNYCFSFLAIQQFTVSNTQQSMVKVYDYYNPDEACTKFYKPLNNSPVQRINCDNICNCLQQSSSPSSTFPPTVNRRQSANISHVTNGCPSDRVLANTAGLSRNERSDKIRNLACRNYDYVWKGQFTGEAYRHGAYFNISIAVLEVLKEGIERKSQLEDEIRIIQVHETCPVLLSGSTYLIMGRDGRRYNGNGGFTQYRYVLDQSSVIHLWAATYATRDRELQLALNTFARNLLVSGCSS